MRSLTSSKLLSPTTTTPSRLFHTTPSRSSDIPVPPESPHFIALPEMPQNDETKRPPIKGHLPVPRALFTKRAHKAHKLSGTYVEDTAPYSAAEAAGLPPKSEKDAWKRLMAESRRRALDTGINNLWRRKVRRDGREKQTSDARAAAHRADADAPERFDETFTRGTVTQATLSTAVPRDPLYAQKQLESQARTAAMQQAKREARKDSIQRLYVEAGRFILTEAELAAKVDELFSESHFKSHTGLLYKPENVWEAHGRPVTVRDMLAELQGKSNNLVQSMKADASKTAQRQKIVAGELTGGALSVI